VFCGIQNTPNAFQTGDPMGELTTPPQSTDPLVGWGGIPLPISHLFCASIEGYCPPNSFLWNRVCVVGKVRRHFGTAAAAIGGV